MVCAKRNRHVFYKLKSSPNKSGNLSNLIKPLISLGCPEFNGLLLLCSALEDTVAAAAVTTLSKPGNTLPHRASNSAGCWGCMGLWPCLEKLFTWESASSLDSSLLPRDGEEGVKPQESLLPSSLAEYGGQVLGQQDPPAVV